MLKPVRIYRHDEPVDAGYFIEFLKSHKCNYELIAIDQGDAVSADFNNASALVFLGGDSSVNDSFGWIEDEIKLIQHAAAENFPVFGHCFGAQLISKALGGVVSPMQHKEIGWFTLDWLENPVSQQWFGQLSNDIQAIHWHQYSLTVPKGATPLFGTKHCPSQAFVLNNMIATTAHVEATAALIAQWLAEYGDDLVPATQTVQSEREIIQDINTQVENMQRLTNVLYQRWWAMVKNYHNA